MKRLTTPSSASSFSNYKWLLCTLTVLGLLRYISCHISMMKHIQNKRYLRALSVSDSSVEEAWMKRRKTKDQDNVKNDHLSHQLVNNSSSSTIISQNESVSVDFAIIGFPKTGTTFLHNVLRDHPDIVMGGTPKTKTEFCQINNPYDGVERTMAWLNNVSNTDDDTVPVPQKTYGIKCPTMVRQMSAIANLVKMSDHTRLVVGVRHPILWFESFYNHR